MTDLTDLLLAIAKDPEASRLFMLAARAQPVDPFWDLILSEPAPLTSWEQAATVPPGMLYCYALGEYLRRTGKL